MRKPCFLLSAWCVYLETSFRKKIRAGEARMILTRYSTTSWLPQHFLFLRQIINICVKCRYHALRTIVRACARFAHIILGEFSPCVTETIVAYPFCYNFRYNLFFLCFGCTSFQSILDIAKGVVSEEDFCEVCEVGYFNFPFFS